MQFDIEAVVWLFVDHVPASQLPEAQRFEQRHRWDVLDSYVTKWNVTTLGHSLGHVNDNERCVSFTPMRRKSEQSTHSVGRMSHDPRD